jgi:hypothetical protein
MHVDRTGLSAAPDVDLDRLYDAVVRALDDSRSFAER